MTQYKQLNQTELATLHQQLQQAYAEVQAQGLSLDMTRGKPNSEQLDLSNNLLRLPGNSYTASDGTDCRNYGGLDGLPEMKALFADMLGTAPGQVIVGGNSSLTMMYDAIARACLFGVDENSAPWDASSSKFLCPSPGYDRHFGITETLGFELITVSMTDDGPEMDQVEALVANDPSIKGIWCVPKYSNPTGVTYSDAVVQRLSSMKTAADDFRVMWDNAYAEHHIDGALDTVLNIIDTCAAAGNPDRAYVFASTSKISMASAGVAAFASSADNVTYAKKYIAAQSIGPDKINQLRHIALFGDLAGLRAHMNHHAALLKPRFDAVQTVLHQELKGLGIAEWTDPKGGYFTSLDMALGSAKRAIALCTDAGVKLTEAGATFPYGQDPDDSNIRIAPSFPSVADIESAMHVFSLCLKLSALEALTA